MPAPRKATKRATRPVSRKRRENRRFSLGLLSIEWLSLGVFALLGTMLALGTFAHIFSGLGFFAHVLPFAAGAALWMLICALWLLLWWQGRRILQRIFHVLPASLALMLAVGMTWFVWHDGYDAAFTDLSHLVGGKQQAARTTLAHQVYAAYRRQPTAQLQTLLQRAAPFSADIQQAATAFQVDSHLLHGIAATESSFLPRNSRDGGQGLFQITAVPKAVLQQARSQLAVTQLDLALPKHNAFVAAATLRHYLQEMHGDLFLGLLAYNIGPHNGGLRFIMQQYGARDFVSLQPYLQQLPRDYPIRVLAQALAFRVWQTQGQLLAYEVGDNASKIQQLGIPGIVSDF